MKRTVYTIFIFLFAAVFFTTVGVAQVEEMAIGNTFGVGARTMGMGGASLSHSLMISPRSIGILQGWRKSENLSFLAVFRITQRV